MTRLAYLFLAGALAGIGAACLWVAACEAHAAMNGSRGGAR